MLAFLLPIALGEERVSFDALARPAPEVVRGLGERIGESLRADPLFGRQILSIHLDKAPVSEVLERLATTLGGEWERDGKTRKLVRPPRLAREIELRERQSRIAAFRRAVDDLGIRAKVERAFGAAEAREAVTVAETSTDRTPLARLLVRLLDDETLAAGLRLGPSERAVWAVRPHPSQRMFSTRQARDVATFGTELREWQAAVAAANPNSRGALGYRSEASVEGEPDRVLLIVSRYVGSRGLGAKLLVADRTGRVTGRQTLNFSEIRRLPLLAPVAGETADLQLSEAGRRLARGEWSDEMARPTRIDPLAEVSRLLVQAASRHRPNVLAVLPDAVFRAYPTLAIGGLTSAQVLGVVRGHGADLKEEGAWAILQPDMPVTEARLRIDRAALERVLAGLEGRSRLDPVARYVVEGGEGAWIWGALDHALASARRKELSDDGLALAVYGSLSARERESLLQAGSLPVGRLPMQTRAYLERMAYRVMGMRLRLEGRPPEEDRDSLRELELSLGSENTEILPRGLPDDAVFQATRRFEPKVTIWRFRLALGNGAVLAFELRDAG